MADITDKYKNKKNIKSSLGVFANLNSYEKNTMANYELENSFKKQEKQNYGKRNSALISNYSQKNYRKSIFEKFHNGRHSVLNRNSSFLLKFFDNKNYVESLMNTEMESPKSKIAENSCFVI